MTLLAESEIESIARPPASGRGHVVLRSVDDETVATSYTATSPLKLLLPKARGSAAWIFSSTYGGGLLGGDSIHVDLEAGDFTRALLSTQSSTKIYRTTGPISHQQTDIRIGEDAIAVIAPDPIVCFAGSKFEQRQRFELAHGAGLVAIDWLTSGRRARGERWAFDRYASRTEVFVEEKCVFRDHVVLDPTDGPLDRPMRMGRCDCFATILVIGKPFETSLRELLAFADASPIESSEKLRFALSPIEGGVVIRVAGRETETVGHWIRERLAFVSSVLGENPWSRKY